MEGRLIIYLFLVSLFTAASSASEAGKVKVTVFYEALCPDSKKFITKQLYPVWNELKHIIELDINAYGKAHEVKKGNESSFRCQHGPRECAANAMLTCAKKYIPDEQKLMDFTNCLMEKRRGILSATECADLAGVDLSDVARCHHTAEGATLQSEIGERQQQLDPPLYYVPWILINDVFTKSQLTAAQRNLREVICKLYEGECP
ncbi:GILT-like protein 1 [Penaeus chinensis]|uniref:GILT-like protein 1 n=1 Tax=Penaeus chinensis TaxID=139456 RepID=UPI001FB7504B|nr:GILT-like protein 1 [Penaeus chinensis]